MQCNSSLNQSTSFFLGNGVIRVTVNALGVCPSIAAFLSHDRSERAAAMRGEPLSSPSSTPRSRRPVPTRSPSPTLHRPFTLSPRSSQHSSTPRTGAELQLFVPVPYVLPSIQRGGISECEADKLQEHLDAVEAAHAAEDASLAELQRLAFGAGVCDGALDLLSISERDTRGGELTLVRRAQSDALLLARKDDEIAARDEALEEMAVAIAVRDGQIAELERIAINAETALAEGALSWAKRSDLKDLALSAKSTEVEGLRDEVARLSALQLERLRVGECGGWRSAG